ncbi:MAG: gliding motility-associated ABC transporter substrate-binding protein GldG [Bacteroidales bacterium]|nr:gliding motility-associated ABC transporter substrate-binding protein GldG [Bacteroidales bacterium]
MKRKEVKKQNIYQLLLAIIIIVLINYVSSFKFFRIDLTSEKRYTISESTKELLKNLEDVIFIQIYLDGDLPYGFKRLQKASKEIIDEFRIYAGNNIEYEFFNPAESSDKKTRNEIFRQLYEKGLEPTNLQVKEKDGAQSQKIIFPGAILNYRNKEIALNLLVNNYGKTSETNLNSSIQGLEYEFINAIRKIILKKIKKIAFIEGHGELNENEVADIAYTLSEFYSIHRVKINGQLNSLNNFPLIIIAKPDSTFNEKDKYVIDQYLMNGGKIIWFIDMVKTNMDSLAYSNTTIAFLEQLNLEDQLFQYGVRINPNLIQDLQCAVIPIKTGMIGPNPKFSPAPWLYFPLIAPSNSNPVTKNMNLIKSEFVSVIDTVGENKNVKKTILLNSSKYSRVVKAPLRISLDMVNNLPDEKYFNRSYQPIAVLLEGKFESVFKNRLTNEIISNNEINYKDTSVNTKMIVVSDGDIIKNKVKYRGENVIPYPLGYDRYTKQTFGNKEFVVNSINYLFDDNGLMNTRSKEFKLRLLDKTKINNEKLRWQLINTLVPVIFIIIFGVFWNIIRKRKYNL